VLSSGLYPGAACLCISPSMIVRRNLSPRRTVSGAATSSPSGAASVRPRIRFRVLRLAADPDRGVSILSWLHRRQSRRFLLFWAADRFYASAIPRRMHGVTKLYVISRSAVGGVAFRKPEMAANGSARWRQPLGALLDRCSCPPVHSHPLWHFENFDQTKNEWIVIGCAIIIRRRGGPFEHFLVNARRLKPRSPKGPPRYVSAGHEPSNQLEHGITIQIARNGGPGGCWLRPLPRFRGGCRVRRKDQSKRAARPTKGGLRQDPTKSP